MTLHRIHGLVVSTDLAIDAATVDDHALVDVTVTAGEARPVPDEAAPGPVIVDVATDARRFYVASRTSDGIVMRYPGICEFVIDDDLEHITWHADPRSDRGFASILLTGGVLALLLLLRGALVLHASAVKVEDDAIAFVGRAGMGKSTLAALVALEGHPLVTDDVLRVEITADGAMCHGGTAALRLREAASALVEGAEGARVTADGRTALWFDSIPAGALPLRAIAVPYPDRERPTLEVERVPMAEAHLLLTRFPRLPGWQDPATLREQFQLLADLVERVPVFRVRVPWGPPFERDLVEQLLRGTGLRV